MTPTAVLIRFALPHAGVLCAAANVGRADALISAAHGTMLRRFVTGGKAPNP